MTEKELLEHCQEKYYYDPMTGQLTSKKTEKEIGYISRSTLSDTLAYRLVKVGGKTQCVHRLIFLMMEGRLPEWTDHIDGDGLNNRWGNLQESSPSHNRLNTKMYKNNKSGYCGVYAAKEANLKHKWVAAVRYLGKKHRLGYFETAEEAGLAASVFREKLPFSDRHGL